MKLNMIVMFIIASVFFCAVRPTYATTITLTNSNSTSSVNLTTTGHTTGSGTGFTVFGLTGMGDTSGTTIGLGSQADAQLTGLEINPAIGVADGRCPQCGVGLLTSTTSTGLVVDYGSLALGSSFLVRLADFDTTNVIDLSTGNNKIVPDLLIFDTSGKVIQAFNYTAMAGAMTFVGSLTFTDQSGHNTTADTWDLNLGKLYGSHTIGGYVLYTDAASNQAAPNDPYFLITTPNNPVTTPEPTTLVLLGSALGLTGLVRLRRK